jgi:hypothetical protein
MAAGRLRCRLERTPDGRALLLSRVTPGNASRHPEATIWTASGLVPTFRALASVPVPDGVPALSEVLKARFARARAMAGQRQHCITAQDLGDAEERAGGVRLAEVEGTVRMTVRGWPQSSAATGRRDRVRRV